MTDAPKITSAEAARHGEVVMAGYRSDHDRIAAGVVDESPVVRAASWAALARTGELTATRLAEAFRDPAPTVRKRAAELCVEIEAATPEALLTDPDPGVVEVAAFVCGELPWTNPPLSALSSIATSHDNALCRESAAAALGAIGHPDGLPAVLTACTDRVTVRRRATLALAAFDDPRAHAALRSALEDQDWQVRQAAEDLLEVGRRLEGDPDPDAYADQAPES